MKTFKRRYRLTRIDKSKRSTSKNGDQLYVEVFPTGDERKDYEAQRKLRPKISTTYLDHRKTS